MEQKPRAQSRAIAVKPQKIMLLFTSSFRVGKGSKGYHQVNRKYGVSESLQVAEGAWGIIF